MSTERRKSSAPDLQTWQWFLLAAAVPLMHCASRLNLDLWHDEIYTVDYFVRRGPAFIVTDYSAPNNHVLYSLLLWPFYRISASNPVLRLPSFVCGVGTLLAVFALAKQLRGTACAVLSTALLGLNQMFLIFAMQVRGYGLSMFLAAFLAWLAFSDVLAGWRRSLAIALAGAGLLYVMPTNVLFFAPLALIACSMRRISFRQFTIESSGWLLAVAIAMLCYLPIIAQVRKAAASASHSTWSYLPVIAGNFLKPATHDLVWLAPLFLAGMFAWLLPRREGKPRHFTLPVLSAVVVAGAFVLTVLLGISPFERNYCPLLVFLAWAEGWLLTELADRVRERWAPSGSSEATAIALAIVSLVLWPRLWTYPRRLEQQLTQHAASEPLADGYFCYYAAGYRPSAVVRYLLDNGIEQSSYRVCFTDVDHLNLVYYFAQLGLPSAGFDDESSPRDTVLFAVVPQPPPWERLANDCRLTADQIDAFHLVGDFGYYRLYQAAEPRHD